MKTERSESMKLTLKANSKINLLLDITGLKKNGYHSLFTIMQSLSLGDIVTVEKREGEEITGRKWRKSTLQSGTNFEEDHQRIGCI